MFEAAELGRKVSKAEYNERAPLLRQGLLIAQRRLAEEKFPVILLFGGVDGAGKSETANQLASWVDARRLVTRSFGEMTEEERERPEYWRYWRDLPPKGNMGVFLSAWYSRPFLDFVYDRCDEGSFNLQLDSIVDFERTLADDGALILKFWMHLGKEAQRHRFETLEADPLQSWRVSQKDWQHWEMYDRFIPAAEHMIMRTSTGHSPWTIVEGANEYYRSLKVGSTLLEALERRLDEADAAKNLAAPSDDDADAPDHSHPELALPGRQRTVLDPLDMSKRLDKETYKQRLKELQSRLHQLHLRARQRKVSTLLVFEGWDAGGKGGAIRRIIGALDSRNFQVISIAAPTDEEAAQHYLWRFWRHLPRAGRVTIYDRSWYGRVLVERVEGFATEKEWRRAFAEINDFERQLVDQDTVILKFWLHVTREEQAKRFKAREETPHKSWKLTEEDWRNREKWSEYALAVNEMVERTSTRVAPWILIEGNDKRYARIRVLEALCDALERKLGKQPELPAAQPGDNGKTGQDETSPRDETAGAGKTG